MAVIADTDDVGALYRVLAKRLEQLVRLDVRAPDPVIEDACQAAWSRFVDHRARVRVDATLSWLVTTAVREARRLAGRDQRELSLDDALEQVGEPTLRLRSAPVEELLEQRERLAAVGQLPERQQRLLWLHALAFAYQKPLVPKASRQRPSGRRLLRR